MKNKLSILGILMIIVLVLASCGISDDNSQGSEPTQSGQNTNAADNTQAQTDKDADNQESGKTLVVYYSASGYTKAVAETIAKTVEADLFELVPSEVYSSDDLNWRDENSRVCKEYADEDLRYVPLVATTIENWKEYDTVFIGYPIWWGIAAWPVNGFVEANDFTGKTVIPFCTSSSSGIGDRGTLLEELAGTGDWQAGQRFRSNVSTDDVVAWLKSLEI